jgi:hypothetical protein
MDKTIGFIVTRAFSIAKIKKANIAVEDDEMDDGIDTYNDLITQFSIDGINLGATIVSVKTDETGLPDWSLEMMKTQLALRLADEFDRPVSVVLGQRADRAMRAVLEMVGDDIVSTPATYTPRGSGNTRYNDGPTFYPDTECGTILTGGNENLLTDEGQTLKDNTGCNGVNGDSGF